MNYDPKTFTWGFEMEVGDADRRLPLPEHLGKWEFSETDVVNLNPPSYSQDEIGILGDLSIVKASRIPLQSSSLLLLLSFNPSS